MTGRALGADQQRRGTRAVFDGITPRPQPAARGPAAAESEALIDDRLIDAPAGGARGNQDLYLLELAHAASAAAFTSSVTVRNGEFVQ